MKDAVWSDVRRRVGWGAALGTVLALLTGPAPAAAQEGEALALLEQASQRYEELHGLCADFAQELQVPLLGQTIASRGRMCQMDPSFFRMDFSDPDGDVIVADGTHLWMYLPSAQPGQAIRREMGESGQRIDFQREFLEDPGIKYAPEWVGPEQVDGKATQHVRLIPQTSSDYNSAEVWLDEVEFLIRRIRIEHTNGSVRILELTRIDLAPDLNADDFRYTPPAGTNVVGGP